jgi:NitT/TauT family transport system substrate-binding protein
MKQNASSLTRRDAVGLLAAGAAVGLRPIQANAQNPTPVRVGASVDTGITPLLYARQAGLFKKAGLDIEIVPGQNGAALAAGVVGGALDFAKSALMPLITAHARGLPFKIVAGAAEDSADSQTNLLCALKTSGMKSLADANGRTVAVSTLKGLDMLGTQLMIARAGADLSTVKFIELTLSTMFPALEQGRSDIASIGYPYLPAALESGKVITFGDPYRGIGDHIIVAGWFTTEGYAKRNPSVVERFSTVMRDASGYVNAHRAETVSILANYARIDPAIVAQMSHLFNATRIDQRSLQMVVDAAAKYKYIDAPFPAKDLLM